MDDVPDWVKKPAVQAAVPDWVKKPAAPDWVKSPRETKQADWYQGALARKREPEPAPGSIDPFVNFAMQEKEGVSQIGTGLAKLNPFSAERRAATIEAGKKPFFSMPSGMSQTGGALMDIGKGMFQAHPWIAGASGIGQAAGNAAERFASWAVPGQKVVRAGDVETAMIAGKPTAKTIALTGVPKLEPSWLQEKTAAKFPRGLPDDYVVGQSVHPVTGQPILITHGEQVNQVWDSFHQLRGQRQADILDVQERTAKYMKEHPDLSDPITKMSHEEGQAIISGHMEGDPEATAKMTPHLRKVMDEYVAPIHKEVQENHEWFRKHNGLSPEEHESGPYMRRRLANLDPQLAGTEIDTPLPTKLNLQAISGMFRKKKTGRVASVPSSEKERTFFAAEKPAAKQGTDGAYLTITHALNNNPQWTKEFAQQVVFGPTNRQRLKDLGKEPGTRGDPNQPPLGPSRGSGQAQAPSRRLLYKDRDGEFRYSDTNEPFNQDFSDERVVPAYTREIEAQTKFKYSKNAFADLAETLLDQRARKREIMHTETLKETGWFKANSLELKKATDEQLATARANGWRGTGKEGGGHGPEHPMFKGMLLDSHLAELVDDSLGARTWSEGYAALNRLMNASLFWSPIVHALNVLGHNIVSRGVQNFTVRGEARQFRALSEAVMDVMGQRKKYREILKKGGTLIASSLDNNDVHKAVLEAMKIGIKKDPIMKRVLTAPWKWSNKALWTMGDILMMQRIREEEMKGLSLDRAIRKVESHIPNYRIPPRVLQSKWVMGVLRNPFYERLGAQRFLSQLMQDPTIGQFNRYHYGVFKSWDNVLTDTIALQQPGIDPGHQMEAAGQLMASIALASLVGDALGSALKWATGDKHAYISAFGPLGLLWSAGIMPGEEKSGSIPSFIARAFALNPLTNALIAGFTNHDPITGADIVTMSGKKGIEEGFRSSPRMAAQAIDKLVQLDFAPYEAAAKGWRDDHTGQWVPQNLGQAWTYAKPFLEQGAALHIPGKAPYDPISGHWRKSGQANDTMYRMRRHGARGPIEYMGAKISKMTKTKVGEAYLQEAVKVLSAVAKHKNPLIGFGGPQ